MKEIGSFRKGGGLVVVAGTERPKVLGDWSGGGQRNVAAGDASGFARDLSATQYLLVRWIACWLGWLAASGQGDLDVTVTVVNTVAASSQSSGPYTKANEHMASKKTTVFVRISE